MTKVALIGRPNVGKSTLFNRIVGKKLAIVNDQPGVTRDLREIDTKILGSKITLVDTAGLEDRVDQSIEGRMRQLTERAISEADICLFIVDARAGITALDEDLASLLRRSNRKLILVANKSEGRASEEGFHDSFRLGLGEPIPISAEHGENIGELYQKILAQIDVKTDETEPNLNLENDPASSIAPIHVAVIGRPNAGKSTLINKIMGEDRLLTGPEAGITRDSIAFDVNWFGQNFKLIDTAGMRKRAKIVDKVEGLSVGDGLRAMKFAEVVILLLDVQKPFEQQDLRLADLLAREGRAVVVAVNKWDLEENKSSRRPELNQMFERLLPQLRGAPLIPISAQTGRGLDRLQQAVLEVYEAWNARIPTAELNRWLSGEISHHPPPAPNGRRIKLKYISQVKSRPPSFVVKTTRASEMPESYKRFLINGLRINFNLWGTPLRMNFRSDKNPYAKK